MAVLGNRRSLVPFPAAAFEVQALVEFFEEMGASGHLLESNDAAPFELTPTPAEIRAELRTLTCEQFLVASWEREIGASLGFPRSDG